MDRIFKIQTDIPLQVTVESPVSPPPGWSAESENRTLQHILESEPCNNMSCEHGHLQYHIATSSTIFVNHTKTARAQLLPYLMSICSQIYDLSYTWKSQKTFSSARLSSSCYQWFHGRERQFSTYLKGTFGQGGSRHAKSKGIIYDMIWCAGLLT